ncbi:MAG: hypothetical protein KDD58_07160 [Bdellovibrionales bacterium]|nr:hypothetical protein [Bdellovibrionales bacterium]
MKFLTVIFLSVFFSLLAQSESKEVKLLSSQLNFIDQPVELNEESIGAWVSQLKVHVNTSMLDPQGRMQSVLTEKGKLTDEEAHLISYYVEVKPLQGTKRVYLALFYSRQHMNKTLIKSSLYQDGGLNFEAGNVPKGNELFLYESIIAARGLNLRGSKITAMFTESQRQGRLLYKEEQAFKENILSNLNARHTNEDYFIIGFNVTGFSLDTLGHEVAHSLYDTLPGYRNVINNFWMNKVSEVDKEVIRQRLSGIYSTEEVIIDEFQAYLLQPKVPAPQSEMLHDFVGKYMSALIVDLKANNLPLPIIAKSCNSVL